ncbi:PREDICTED: uncharacterized protein LOC108377840, partial [Rhagoletis zephyria]|uniref:uncharacterized protein LOC108377840 n=1 Tax=Rhagoletis zephyria TaxID=28612 RepID=UPI0008116673
MTNYAVFEKFDKATMQWSRWVARFEETVTMLEVSEKNKSLLLIYMGQETYDMLYDKLAPATPAEKTYAEIKRIISDVYDPAPLEIMENYRFHLRKQNESESVEEFSIALRKLAINCNFGTYLETALRNQFVFGLRSTRIQNRLLETKDLKMDAALTTAKAMELSAKGGAEIQQQKDVKSPINYIQQKNKKGKKITIMNSANSKANKTKVDEMKMSGFCFRCGKSEHRANKCPHQNSTCSFCNVKGHLSSVCFKAKKEKKQTNYIDCEDHTNAVEELFNINTDNFNYIKINHNKNSKIYTQLK